MYLSNSSGSSVEYRVVDIQQFLQEESVPHGINGGHQDVKVGHTGVVGELRDDLLPRLQPLALKVDIVTKEI